MLHFGIEDDERQKLYFKWLKEEWKMGNKPEFRSDPGATHFSNPIKQRWEGGRHVVPDGAGTTMPVYNFKTIQPVPTAKVRLLTCSIWDKDAVGKDDLPGSFTYDVSGVAVGEEPMDIWLESTTHSVAKALIR